MSDKPLVWVGSSLDDTRSFPIEARRIAGYQLRRVQNGLMPDDWKLAQQRFGLVVAERRKREK